MRTIALACLLVSLTACATRWTNPQNPSADLRADEAVCQKDAERLVRLDDLARPAAGAEGCMQGPNCATQAQNRDFQRLNLAMAAQKRCMVNKGWRQD